MALDKATPIHFDRYDNTSVVDADGTIHLPVVRQGSTIEFHFRLRDQADSAVIPNAGYTFRGEFRNRDGGTVEATVAFTNVDGFYTKARVTAAAAADMKATAGVFNMEYQVDDGAPADDMVHRFAEGTYIMVPGDVT